MDQEEELRDLIAMQNAEIRRGERQSSEFEGMASLDQARGASANGEPMTLHSVIAVDPTDAIIEAIDEGSDPADAPDPDPQWFGRSPSRQVWDRRMIVAKKGGEGHGEHRFRWTPQFRQQYGASSRKSGKPAREGSTEYPATFTRQLVGCMAGGHSIEDFLAVATRRGPTRSTDRGSKEMVALTVQMLRAAGWSTQAISDALGLSKQRISTLERHALPILSAAAERLGWTSPDADLPVPASDSDATAARSDEPGRASIIAGRRRHVLTIPEQVEEVTK